ncbi:MAG: 3-oxoacyl-[acyl-carrier protein] reductase, partial [Actinomycetota bacterium]|nr:3-oxoacyl-[acyl-carrier protein] reductase [Actinomycetota bacterium]
MDLGLTDRVYVVTGASKGLGRAGAAALLADGARVALCARDEDTLNATAAELDAGDRVMAIAGDLAEPGTESRLVAAAMGRWGRLDGALISVGGPPPGSASLVGDDAWRKGFE